MPDGETFKEFEPKNFHHTNVFSNVTCANLLRYCKYWSHEVFKAFYPKSDLVFHGRRCLSGI